MAGLIKEIWLASLQMLWQEKPTWLKEATDLGQYLTGDGMVLNLAHADADPLVRINNNVWPLTVQQLSETASNVPLDYYLTDPTVVHEADKKGFGFDKQKGDVQRHLNAILNEQHKRGAYNAAPTQAALGRPVIMTTGTAGAFGRKALRFADLISLGEQFDAAGVDPENRHLVLSAAHVADLERENLEKYKILIEAGRIVEGFGFKVHRSSFNPCYDAEGEEKSSFGVAENPAVGIWQASFAFQKESLGFARGAAKFFSKMDDPEWAGTIINYGQYFMCLPVRAYGLGAIANAQD